MAENSKIEWTDHTFNAWVGCTKIKGKNGAPSACDFCYAEAWAKRTGDPELWNGKRRRTSEANWRAPIRWNAAAEKAGKRARVFCCSLADVFDNQAEPQWRADLFSLIRATPWLEWQLLTKRPQNILKMVKAAGGLPRNAALGATTENQTEADRRIPRLIEAAALLRPLYTFISAEPLLGPLHLGYLGWPSGETRKRDGYNALIGCRYENGEIAERLPKLDWVICGGESGGKARPMHPGWARSLYLQCKAAGVPFLFKQWGEWTPGENVKRQHGSVWVADWFAGRWSFARENLANNEGHVDDQPDLYRVGKKEAGRALDGLTHDCFPEVRAA
jgi:protein gp37